MKIHGVRNRIINFHCSLLFLATIAYSIQSSMDSCDFFEISTFIYARGFKSSLMYWMYPKFGPLYLTLIFEQTFHKKTMHWKKFNAFWKSNKNKAQPEKCLFKLLSSWVKLKLSFWIYVLYVPSQAIDSAHTLLEKKRSLWQLVSLAYWQITPAANVRILRNHLRRTRCWIWARQRGHSSIGASHTEHVHRCPHGRNMMSHWKLGRKMFKKSCSNLSLQKLGRKRFFSLFYNEWKGVIMRLYASEYMKPRNACMF